MSATVIIPTTGMPEVRNAIDSVLNQTYEDTVCYLVCDGEQYYNKVKAIVEEYNTKHIHKSLDKLKVCYLPVNVGANGFYGHRVYAAFTHLINTEYVLYLDQDNWLDKDHVKECVYQIEENNLDWSFSLRKIVDKDGNYLCNDDCESLGKWPMFQGVVHTGTYHIDTNCYCVKTEVATKLCQVWHGGWGQDRVFYTAMTRHFTNFDCTGKYTVNYRLAGNEGSVRKEFFEFGNEQMKKQYNGVYPWRKI